MNPENKEKHYFFEFDAILSYNLPDKVPLFYWFVELDVILYPRRPCTFWILIGQKINVFKFSNRHPQVFFLLTSKLFCIKLK